MARRNRHTGSGEERDERSEAIVRHVGAILGIAAIAVLLAACGSSSKGPVTLNWYVFPEPSGSFAKAASDCSSASGGKYTIKINFLSTASDQQRVSLVRRLAAKDPSIDILAMDVDWTAEFATAKWILPWSGANAAAVSTGVLPGPLQTATWDGKLYAAPINSNTQLLWYRKDLVPNPPKTWTQMIDEAVALAKQGKPHYIEDQGAKYEGLTVWFNSLVDSAGGGILTKDNKVILDKSTQAAAQIMERLANSPAADPGLNVAEEAQSETAWEHGTAAFQITYPFVWSAAKKDSPSIFKHMGYAAFPSVTPGTTPKVSIGGYNLGVSAYSQHPQLAFDAVKCLVQNKNQVRDAIKGGLAPVLSSIYSVPSFEKAYPFHELIKSQLQDYGLRPQTPAYADITLAVQNALSPTSAIDPKTIVSTLRSEVKQALSSGALL
jgi:multiple sugar transport system substrate-binding protein